MKTRDEVEAKIRQIEADFSHVLTGSVATVVINAPRALEQVAAETKLATLHWVLGTKFKSKWPNEYRVREMPGKALSPPQRELILA
jgi:hypothetical protein